jgi:hypothetical protein
MDLFASSGEGKETPSLLGPLGQIIEVISFYGTQQNMCLSPITWTRKHT